MRINTKIWSRVLIYIYTLKYSRILINNWSEGYLFIFNKLLKKKNEAESFRYCNTNKDIFYVWIHQISHLWCVLSSEACSERVWANIKHKCTNLIWKKIWFVFSFHIYHAAKKMSKSKFPFFSTFQKLARLLMISQFKR